MSHINLIQAIMGHHETPAVAQALWLAGIKYTKGKSSPGQIASGNSPLGFHVITVTVRDSSFRALRVFRGEPRRSGPLRPTGFNLC